MAYFLEQADGVGTGADGEALDDAWIGQPITINAADGGAGATYLHEVLDEPGDSSVTLLTPTAQVATFTPEVTGTILLRTRTTTAAGAVSYVRRVVRVKRDVNGVLLNGGICPTAFGELAGDANYGGNDRGYVQQHEENWRAIEGSDNLPPGGVFLAASGDTTGATDRAALAAIVATAQVAVLQSAATYYDDGTAITYHASARVITTDERPSFWLKGSTATTHMTAQPACMSQSGSTIIMRLPPAVNWNEQCVTCEATGAITVTIDPDGAETVGPLSTVTVGGAGDRMTILSRGTSTLTPIDGGATTGPVQYADTLIGVSGPQVLRAGPIATTVRELDNYQFMIGDLRSADAFAKGTAIVGLSMDQVNLFDWQIFGQTDATTFLYWREAYTEIGLRIQCLHDTQGYILSALGTSNALTFELNGSGNNFRVTAAALGYYALDIDGDSTVILATDTTIALRGRTVATAQGGVWITPGADAAPVKVSAYNADGSTRKPVTVEATTILLAGSSSVSVGAETGHALATSLVVCNAASGIYTNTGTIYRRSYAQALCVTETYASAGECSLDVVTASSLALKCNAVKKIEINSTGIGFFAATPAAKPEVTGSRGGNAALASLLTALATLGLITDSSTT